MKNLQIKDSDINKEDLEKHSFHTEARCTKKKKRYEKKKPLN